jgi:hypothetical protein
MMLTLAWPAASLTSASVLPPARAWLRKVWRSWRQSQIAYDVFFSVSFRVERYALRLEAGTRIAVVAK